MRELLFVCKFIKKYMPRIYPESIQKKEKTGGQTGAEIGVKFGSKIAHFFLDKKVKKIILLIYAPYIPGGYSKKKRKKWGSSRGQNRGRIWVKN